MKSTDALVQKFWGCKLRHPGFKKYLPHFTFISCVEPKKSLRGLCFECHYYTPLSVTHCLSFMTSFPDFLLDMSDRRTTLMYHVIYRILLKFYGPLRRENLCKHIVNFLYAFALIITILWGIRWECSFVFKFCLCMQHYNAKIVWRALTLGFLLLSKLLLQECIIYANLFEAWKPVDVAQTPYSIPALFRDYSIFDYHQMKSSWFFCSLWQAVKYGD